ncbi:hypothetical protein [Sphingomonas sp. Leaf343]|uniref:hypothetical protein n=1 Tax=Sphingomonas sp. Leaf343 TaxID=1736345 RepID=UPI000B25B5A4|nr:hypothetical protein [Sphingomonas sp. Leaf343]
MAFLDLAFDLPRAALATPAIGPVRATVSRIAPLERQVLHLAAADTRSSLNEPGRIARMLRWVFAVKTANRLADPRLEALRRFAVLARVHGDALPDAEVDRLIGAGFVREALAEICELVAALPRATA